MKDGSNLMGKVRYKSLFIFAGLFLSLNLSAQVFNAGFGGGLNVSQIEGDGFSGYNKAGPAVGLFVNTFFQEFLAWQMEINYSSKGSTLKAPIEDPGYYRIDLRYIEIPVLLRYLTPPGIIFEAGLSGGYLFYAKEEDALGEIPETVAFRKTEFTVIGGIGYILTDNISLNARISYSGVPIRDHAGGGQYYFNRGQNNNVISFILQYQI